MLVRAQLGSKRPKVFNTFSCFYGGWHSLFFIVSSPAASLSLRLFLSLSLSRWNAHKSPSISEEERKEETRSQPSLMYDSAVRVKKIP